jgi:plasmid stability protein
MMARIDDRQIRLQRRLAWSLRNSVRGLDMCTTCLYVYHMPTMIQIRNVPDALHRRLKSRAALAGMSLSDYLLAELHRVAERPSIGELRERLESRAAIAPSVSPEQAVRAERDAE